MGGKGGGGSYNETPDQANAIMAQMKSAQDANYVPGQSYDTGGTYSGSYDPNGTYNAQSGAYTPNMQVYLGNDKFGTQDQYNAQAAPAAQAATAGATPGGAGPGGVAAAGASPSTSVTPQSFTPDTSSSTTSPTEGSGSSTTNTSSTSTGQTLANALLAPPAYYNSGPGQTTKKPNQSSATVTGQV